MEMEKRGSLLVLISAFIAFFLGGPEDAKGQLTGDTTFLRVSMHVFDNLERDGNFHPDSMKHSIFLQDVIEWINHRMLNLDTLKPGVPSPYVKSIDVQVRTDSIFYHMDDLSLIHI